MIRILVTGSRHIDLAGEMIVRGALGDAIRTAARRRCPVVIVHGAARGVDAVADQWGAPPALGVTVERHPADWTQRGAGPARNARMVALGADVCLAFPRRDSRGTWDCIRRAAGAGIPVRIYPLPDLAADR